MGKGKKPLQGYQYVMMYTTGEGYLKLWEDWEDSHVSSFINSYVSMHANRLKRQNTLVDFATSDFQTGVTKAVCKKRAS